MLRNRLLAAGSLLLASGIAVDIYLSGYKMLFLAFILGVLCILLCAVHFLNIALKPKVIAIFCILPIVGMLFCSVYRMVFVMPYNVFDDKQASVTGKIVEIPRDSFYDELHIKVISSDCGLPKNTLISLNATKNTTDFDYGDVISFTGWLHSVTNDEGYTSKSIYLSCYAEPTLVSANTDLIFRIKNSFIDYIDNAFDQREGSLIKAITIASTNDLDNSFYAVLSSIGAVHVLSVSGFHLTLLIMTIYQVMVFLSVNKYIRGVLCIALSLFYCALTGFSPPAVRSALMISIMLAAQMMFYQSDSITVLFAVLGFLLVLNPFALASISLQLSFLATLGILIASPYIERMNPFKKHILKRLFHLLVTPFIFSFVAMLFTFPIMATTFNRISIVAPIVNIIVPILFNPLLIFSFIFLIFAPLTTVFYYPAQVFAMAFMRSAEFLYKFEYASVSTHNIFAMICIFISAIAVVLILFMPKRYFVKCAVYGSAMLMVLMIASIFFTNRVSADVLVVSYYENRHTGVVFAANGEHNMIVDISGTGVPVRQAYEHNFIRVDKYIALNYTENLCERISYTVTELRISEVYVPNPSTLEAFEAYTEIRELARSKGFKVYMLAESNMFEVGKASLGLQRMEYGFYMFFDYGGKCGLIAGGDMSEDYADASLDYLIITKYYSPSYFLPNKTKALICPANTDTQAIDHRQRYSYAIYDTVDIITTKSSETEVFVFEY